MASTSAPVAAPHYTSKGPESGIKERYTSREYLDLEAERLWPSIWQLAGHQDQVPEVGDFFEYTIVDSSFLIVRSAPDEIKAFHNACRHRGMQLKVGSGNAAEIRCPSHAWTWELDGTLRSVTDGVDFDPAAVQPDCLALTECRVDTWAGLIFLNIDGQAPPLADYLDPVPTRLQPINLGHMSLVRIRTTVLDANWKLGHEAFIESYHIIGTHPQSLLYVDETGLAFEQHGDHGMHRLKPGGIGMPSSRLTGDEVPDRMDTLMALVGDMSDAGLYKGDERAEVDALGDQPAPAADGDAGEDSGDGADGGVDMGAVMDAALSLPEGASIGPFFAEMRRQVAAAQGVDLSDAEDADLLEFELWNVFPNFTVPCNAVDALVIRFRPNGRDPESCLVDVFYLERRAPGVEAKVEVEVYEHWTDCHWGRILEQDFTNLPRWQKAVHSPGFPGPIWGRQDGNNVNFHRALRDHVGR
jgi:phenylpropionate dioxygenase-like ring-hydroxylating dioxygenase large terminal subunit